MDIQELEVQYSQIGGQAERLREAVVEQLSKVLDDAEVSLGVPMESRVKEWPSIAEKIERKSLSIDDLLSLPDLIGIRTILLFRSDLEPADSLIRASFEVVESEDTGERLGDAQFGYQSQHYVVKIPEAWRALPTMSDLGDLQVEIQVRTVAQHIWAAASHKLQYKHEASVPPPLRRTINRVSALLETVDLEFDRVLSERKSYQETEIPATSGSEPLNVDILASMLAGAFPAENRVKDEPFEDLLNNLTELSVRTIDDLRPLLEKHLDAAMDEEQVAVSQESDVYEYGDYEKERLNRGVYLSHVGLAREVLRAEFGEEVEEMFVDDGARNLNHSQ